MGWIMILVGNIVDIPLYSIPPWGGVAKISIDRIHLVLKVSPLYKEFTQCMRIDLECYGTF